MTVIGFSPSCLFSWTKNWEPNNRLLTTYLSPTELVLLYVCHLWLLVMTRLSGCPLGSSLSLLLSLSWRALRLLSRAASSSSSSFFANLTETKEERERVRRQRHIFFFFSNLQLSNFNLLLSFLHLASQLETSEGTIL